MSTATKRESGFYWCKQQSGDWEPCEYVSGLNAWWALGQGQMLKDEDFLSIYEVPATVPYVCYIGDEVRRAGLHRA